jgi:hypothetical protein
LAADYTWVNEPGPRVSGTRDLDRSKVQAPGVVRDPAGGFRLFYTAVGPAAPFPACQGYILSAHSEDGVRFQVDPGIRVAPDPEVPHRSRRCLAPTIATCAGGWRMYFESRGPADVAAVIGSAVSADLLVWEVEEGPRLALDHGVASPSYVDLQDGRGRLYCAAALGGRGKGVVSAVTENGVDFELEAGFRVRDGLTAQENSGITAADVIVPLQEGDDWTMLYSAWEDVPPGTQVPAHPSLSPGAEAGGVEFARASIASDLAGYRSRIYTARSADGLSWERVGCVIEGDGYGHAGTDAVHAEDMSIVMLDDGGYRMYYAACDSHGEWCVTSARTA